jgi:UPF0716 protein FxsA
MPPLLLLFILFTAIPLLELWLLFQLSGLFGFWTTIGLVLGTGFAGAALARWQGWQVMERVQGEMRQGMLPASALGDGALILVAGVLLITPGVLTDLFGLSLLVPPVRALVKRAVGWWWAHHVQAETVTYWQTQDGSEATGYQQGASHDKIIDAHVVSTEVVDEP